MIEFVSETSTKQWGWSYLLKETTGAFCVFESTTDWLQVIHSTHCATMLLMEERIRALPTVLCNLTW